MPTSPHIERHFTGGQIVRDVVIGMSDGLTVPFALAAGLSGAVAASRIVVTAGLAEVAAGSIAMGLGGYLAARSDAEHYAAELARERREVAESPELEVAEVEHFFARYGLQAGEVEAVIDALRRAPAAWVEFMMRFELGLERPDPAQALRTATTIALAYVVGGLVPLVPYFFLPSTQSALLPSVALTAVALLVFGFVKGRYTTGRMIRSAAQTLVVGGLAAAAAFGLARLFA
jgi:VIT1/CCC1 family predicted Fe2+/Mn2+ transporter